MKKRLLSVLLTAAVLLSSIPAAFAASDLEGHWAKQFISYLAGEDVFKASASTGEYKPDEQVTRAEFMRYINRAFHFTERATVTYTDVNAQAWYYKDVQIAAKYGYINGVGNNKMNPLGKITREQAAVIIGRLYKADPAAASPSDLPFTDKDKISNWSASYLKAAADKGILGGYADGSFKPQGIVTRGEVAKILYYYLGTMLSRTGKAYTGADLKSDTENVTISESCSLSDATIAGDLYISEGLGSDAVTLTNVKVEGMIIVSGGTVNMMNTTSDHVIVSSPMGRLLQVTATGASHIKQTQVASAATLFEKGLTTTGYEGFANVTLKGDARVSLTLDAAVSQLVTDSEASVSTTANAAVYHLTANQPLTMTGYGSVYQADIQKNGVSIASGVSVSGYTLASGVTASIGGKNVNTSSAASVAPAKIDVDLNDLTALGAGVEVSLPSGVTASSVTMDGVILSPSAAYTVNSTGFRLLTAYLGTLTRGNHTLAITLSDGKRASIPVAVTNTNATADALNQTFDRYYKSAGFKDVSARITGAGSKNDISSVVLGMTKLDFDFETGTRSMVLRRGLLAQLRAGTYTITVDLAGGGEQLINLTVTDSTPSELNVALAEYDTYNPVEPSFTLPLERLTIRSITVVSAGSAKTLTKDTDYTLGTNTIKLTKSALEKFRRSASCVEYTVTMSDNSVYTLVIDYIS